MSHTDPMELTLLGGVVMLDDLVGRCGQELSIGLAFADGAVRSTD